ncbi:MAG TPA: OsmC family protein [Candidatus Thermoplasmatota archaeon]|nr:OsmC family protein [Candidatus Thermoplasmatota archaeon]
MGEMRLTVATTGKGNALECRTPQGAVIGFDDTDAGTTGSPVQHLLASIGACALMDVDVILRKKRLAYSGLRVECVGQRPDEGTPKPFLDVKLVFRVKGEVPPKAFDDAVRLSVEKYCSVGETVRNGAPIAFEAKLD